MAAVLLGRTFSKEVSQFVLKGSRIFTMTLLHGQKINVVSSPSADSLRYSALFFITGEFSFSVIIMACKATNVCSKLETNNIVYFI